MRSQTRRALDARLQAQALVREALGRVGSEGGDYKDTAASTSDELERLLEDREGDPHLRLALAGVLAGMPSGGSCPRAFLAWMQDVLPERLR